MKKMKKILAMLLALTMVLGMSLTSMAETTTSTGKITVEVPAGSTVTYDQIIVEDRDSVLGWEIVDKFQDAFIKGFLGEDETYTVNATDEATVIQALIDLGALEDINNFVSEGNINTDADEDNALANGDNLGNALAAVQNSLGENVTVAGTTATIIVSTSNIGLYAVKVAKDGYTFIPMGVYVGTGFEDVNATAKGSMDKVEKTVESGKGESVSKGDVVGYTVTVNYPFYSTLDAESKTFVVSDTLTNATFLDENEDNKVDNLEVRVGTTTITEGYVATLKADNVLEIAFTYNAEYAGETVTVTYSAVVGDVSSANPMQNKVQSETASNTTEKVVISDTVKVEVNKVDGDNKPLPGAIFTLYVADENGDKTIKYNGADIKVNVVADSEETDENGVTSFDGLDAQKTYYVQEKKAPKGYKLNDEVKLLTGAALDAEEIIDVEKTTYDVESTVTEGEGDDAKTVKVLTTTYVYDDFDDITIVNTKLSALPSTGGIGTTIFTVAGCGIMIAAAFFFFASRKRENN